MWPGRAEPSGPPAKYALLAGSARTELRRTRSPARPSMPAMGFESETCIAAEIWSVEILERPIAAISRAGCQRAASRLLLQRKR